MTEVSINGILYKAPSVFKTAAAERIPENVTEPESYDNAADDISWGLRLLKISAIRCHNVSESFFSKTFFLLLMMRPLFTRRTSTSFLEAMRISKTML